jgi:hypothetical protein
VKREIGPTILREKWRADLFRADERNRVDGPFVPAEQLAGAVEAISRLADMTDGLPYEETDTPEQVIERAIRLAHQLHEGQ